METFKKILKKIFCLPPLPTVLAAFFGYGFVIAVFALDIQNPILRYASYAASAYALIVTCTGLVYVNTAIGGVKKFVGNHNAGTVRRRRRSAVPSGHDRCDGRRRLHHRDRHGNLYDLAGK